MTHPIFIKLDQVKKIYRKHLYWQYCQRCGLRTDHTLTVNGRTETYRCTTPGCGATKEYVTK